LATFEEQVEALTGITISSSGTNPTQAELTQFLKDGVIDVTDKWLIGHPQDGELFMDETVLQVAQGANLDGAEIISVVRADGVTAGDFRPCRKISPAQQTQVLDTESLSFASKYHPVYMLNTDNTVKVFPVPADNSGKDSYKIYYVNNAPKDGDGNALTFADSTLRSFPADKVHLVALYASVKSINNNMTGIIADLSTFSVSTVIADTLAAPSFSYSNAVDDTSIDSTLVNIPDLEALSSAPTYTPPKVAGATEELTATITDGTVGTDADWQDFSDWFEVLGQMIEDKEDMEMAGVQLNKISTYVNAYGQAMQNQLNEFNEANVKYQAEIQEHMQEAQNEVTRLTTIYSKNTDVNVQNAVNTYRVEVDEYGSKIGKYQAEVQAYASEVNTEVTEQATKIQTEGTRYQWLQDRVAALQAEYIAAFATPQAQPQGGGR
jgi:polyhydroxyalkanoate synthesis regulator protein